MVKNMRMAVRITGTPATRIGTVGIHGGMDGIRGSTQGIRWDIIAPHTAGIGTGMASTVAFMAVVPTR